MKNWVNSHPNIADFIIASTIFTLILISNYIFGPNRGWRARNARITAFYFSLLIPVATLLFLRRKKSLFLAIAFWTLLSVACYTALSWLWGGRFLAGWTNEKPLTFKELLSTTLAAVGGIGAVGYLVIKYREQASTEREEVHQNEGEADKKLNSAIQQLGSRSPQVRIAGVYALADVADTYGSEIHGVDYNKRAVEILCGYLRTVRSENDKPVESAVLSILSNHTTPPENSLSNKKIGPWSRYTIDLRGAILKETINFQGACIASLDCRQAEFYGKADFTNTHFDGDTYFDEAHFRCSANFTGSQFQDDAKPNLYSSFVGTHFHNKVTFDNAHFRCAANFTEAQFQDDAKPNLYSSFVGTHFHNKVTFDNAHFRCAANFTGSQFQPYAKSTRLETTFRGTHFDGDTRFDTVHFYHDANFTGAQFQESADSILNTSFNGTHFHNKATFNNAHFHRNASMIVTGLKVSFRGSHFRGETHFDNTHFWRHAYFDANRDTGYVTTFDKETTFHDAHFNATSFQDAVFSGSVAFGNQYGSRGAKFESKAYFCGAKFKSADFSRVEFAGVDFSNTTFGVVDFSAAHFDLNPLSRLSEVSSLSADFSHATFEVGISFRDILFDRCTTFEGDARFRGATFPQNTSFGLDAFFESNTKVAAKALGAVFKKGADFTEIKHDGISFRGVWFNVELRNTEEILFPDSIPIGKNGLPLGAEWKTFQPASTSV